MDEFLFPFVIGSVVDRNGHSGTDRALCDEPRALQWVHVCKSEILSLSADSVLSLGSAPTSHGGPGRCSTRSTWAGL
jgi:hypothetical protein